MSILDCIRDVGDGSKVGLTLKKMGSRQVIFRRYMYCYTVTLKDYNTDLYYFLEISLAQDKVRPYHRKGDYPHGLGMSIERRIYLPKDADIFANQNFIMNGNGAQSYYVIGSDPYRPEDEPVFPRPPLLVI